MSRPLLLLLLALISSPPADALVESDKFGWTEYRNDRFGLVMRYPSAVFAAHRSSASGDGDLYETPDGKARLLVGAFANTDHFTPRSYQAFIAKQSYPGLKVDYAAIRGTWTVLSGTIDGTMIYEKAMFSCGGWANQHVRDDVSGGGTSLLRPDRRGDRTYIPARRATVRSKCLAFLNSSGEFRASLDGSVG